MDDYDVLKKIGEGSQGSVFHAVQKSTALQFALKLMHCKDQDQVNFAIKEIKALIQFRHPHIVSYIDFFLLLGQQKVRGTQNELSVGLVMELCQNLNLADRIKLAKTSFMETGQHPLRESLVVTWICQAADALQYIHDRGFLHRDLKPTNVFFSQGNEVIKLGDFGLATSAGFGKQSTVGTPYYFAPEILLRQTYDAKVDVWGLGVVILELLTLRERPINSQVLENPLVVESLVSDITSMGFSPKLGCLIRDMLNRYPDGRPTPSAIVQRLTGNQFIVPPNTIPDKSVCNLCEVDVSTVLCVECTQAFCSACDSVRHKNPSRQSHVRTPIISTEIHQPSELPSTTIEIPSPEFPSLSSALVAVGSGRVNKIVIAGGTVLREAIIISSSCPNFQIVGLDPPPIVEVATLGSCISVSADRGSVCNLIFRQVPPRLGSATSEFSCALNVRRGSCVFERCQFESASGFGIACTSGETSPLFQNCKISRSQQAGVLFTEGARGVLTKCIIESCFGTGILLKKRSAPDVLECKIRMNKETGVFCHESLGTFQQNEIYRNEGCAFVIKGLSSAPSLTKNLIFENVQAGIFCCDESSPAISENKIDQNGKAGILVKKFSSPHVIRNVISRGKEAGIFVFESGKGTYEENEICDNANAGVLVTTNGNPLFARNYIRSNAYEGVWICKGGAGTFCGNSLTLNQRGPKDIEQNSLVVWDKNRE